jgi:hypothetical protein
MLTSTRLGEKSPSGCALASWRDRVHLSWSGTDAALNLTGSADGRRFAAPRRLPYSTYCYDASSMGDAFSDFVVTAPAMAGTAEHLYLAWTRADATVALLTANARTFFEPRVFEHRSFGSPAVAVGASARPVMAWAGKDRRVNVLAPAGTPAAPIRLSQARTVVAPALCGHRGALVLAWTGTDRRVNLLTLRDGQKPSAHLRLDAARTIFAPALCRVRDTLLLAWTGTDRRVNLMTVTDNGDGAAVRLNEARSLAAPAVCDHRGRLALAWTGTDAHLNVAFPPMPPGGGRPTRP